MEFPNQYFLTTELPVLLRQLPKDKKPNFGIMTPHHMIEHLVWTTKIFSRRANMPDGWSPSKGVQNFRNFIAKGAPFKYYPKPDQKTEDLAPTRTESMDEAIGLLEKAIADMYRFGKEDPNYKSFHPTCGELSMEQIDLLNGQHSKWHAFQFGLLASFEGAKQE